MEALLENLLNLVTSLWGVIWALVAIIGPWTALIAWVAYWLLAVDWSKLAPVMFRGGVVGVVLLGLMAALVWSVVSPAPYGHKFFQVLKVENFTGKLMYVTTLIVIMYLCGSVQLTGLCGSWASFPEPVEEPAHGHGHGHDDHGGHGGHGAASHGHDHGHGGGHGHGH